MSATQRFTLASATVANAATVVWRTLPAAIGVCIERRCSNVEARDSNTNWITMMAVSDWWASKAESLTTPNSIVSGYSIFHFPKAFVVFERTFHLLPIPQSNSFYCSWMMKIPSQKDLPATAKFYSISNFDSCLNDCSLLMVYAEGKTEHQICSVELIIQFCSELDKRNEWDCIIILFHASRSSLHSLGCKTYKLKHHSMWTICFQECKENRQFQLQSLCERNNSKCPAVEWNSHRLFFNEIKKHAYDYATTYYKLCSLVEIWTLKYWTIE